MQPEDVYPQLIARRADEHPDRVFIEVIGKGSLTYGELQEGALKWARAYAGLGVGRGDHVVVMCTVRPAYFQSWLGLALLGAVDVSINVDYRGDLLYHVLANSKPSVILAAPEYIDRLADVLPRLNDVKALVVLEGGVDVPKLAPRALSQEEFLASGVAVATLMAPGPWDIGAVLYTSGTAGPSKGVWIPWAQLYSQSRNFIPIEDLTPDDVFYTPCVTHHVGAKVFPYLAAQIDGRAVLRERFSATEFWSDVRQFKCTTATLVGAMVPWVTAAAHAEDEASPLRNVVLAPAPANVDAFKSRFGVRVATAYSMTELSTPIASRGWDVSNANHLSCGFLHREFEARVVDEHDQELPPGEVGELIIRSHEPWTLNQGYLGMPEKSFEAWRNGWFHTGDAFRCDEEGRWYFRDRLNDVIRRRGENISSFEIEVAINNHPAVIESAAVAVPSEHTEDEVLVFVRLVDEANLDAEDLIEYLISRIPPFMVPRYIEFVTDLPKTPTDRVQKKLLRERGISEATWDRERARNHSRS
jgi:crotonobetaine/carnitine-CoA ligase